MKDKKVRSRWDRKRVALNTGNETPVQQQFKDEVDVNSIVSRVLRTGDVTVLNRREPNYGFAESVSYHEAMNVIVNTEERFNSLPAKIRDHFNSDIMEFMEAMEKPDFEEVMKGLGTEFVENATSSSGSVSSEQTIEQSEGVSKDAPEGSPAEQADA